MLRSLLIGLTTGSRSMASLALVSAAARAGGLPGLDRRLGWLAKPAVAKTLALLSVGELAGDKFKAAPDRTVAVGLLARAAAGGLAGAALAGRRAIAGGILGAGAAVGGAFLTFAVRKVAVKVVGASASGAAEDAMVLSAARAIVGPVRPPRRSPATP